jgi:DNA-directed RNA polymerase specialized sigma24 family protein
MSDPRPGEWAELTGPQYQRLLALARRRLVGYEHHAEDVVARAMRRWLKIPKDHPSARIETIINSEAKSLLRSEKRLAARQRRATDDRSSPLWAGRAEQNQFDLALVRAEIGQVCQRFASQISTVDVEVLEHLFAGFTIAETARSMELQRHEVKRSRFRWRTLLTAATEEARQHDPAGS